MNELFKENNYLFWKEYYHKNPLPFKPSKFANFVMDYLKPKKTLLELGCGNGRDTVFLAEQNNELKVVAIDQCQNQIKRLQERYVTHPRLCFLNQDITTNIGAFNFDADFDYIYMRFVLHSINQKAESKLLPWVFTNLNSGGYFFIETRGTKDDLYQVGKPVKNHPHTYFTDHYRRFINFEKLLDALKKLGFKIKFAKEARDFAPYQDTNPKIIRIVAQKI